MSYRLLFVDDDARMLEGLQRMLFRPLLKHKAVYAKNGEEAMRLVEEEEFDIVVSDMRMPDYSGAEVLKHVLEHQPGTGRVILSGQCDLQSAIDSLLVAHGFLTKPCKRPDVTAAVLTICEIATSIENRTVREGVFSTDWFPMQPSAIESLDSLFQGDAPDADTLARIVLQCPGLTARLMHIANMGFFGPRHEFDSAPEAIQAIGVDTLRKVLVPGKNPFRVLTPGSCKATLLGEFRHHALATALASEMIAKEESDDPREHRMASLAGLLHSIGSQVLLEIDDYFNKLCPESSGCATVTSREMARQEMESFGISHDAVGANLLRLWGFPVPVIDAIRDHGAPSEAGAGPSLTTVALHVAHHIVGRVAAQGLVVECELDEAYLRECGYADKVQTWEPICRNALDQQTYGPITITVQEAHA